MRPGAASYRSAKKKGEKGPIICSPDRSAYSFTHEK